MANLEAIGGKIAEIEAELKRLGWWSEAPPPPEAFENMGPFGIYTMPFAHWLQFVLIPRVGQIMAEGGGWPSESQVGAHAVREFDGVNEAADLNRLLIEWDAIFN